MEMRQMTFEDWPAVREIYEQGIAGRNATFETEAPDWDAWNRSQLDRHRLVAVEDERVVGWIVVHAVSPRPCYAGVVEHSVYVADGSQGKGVGRALLERLIADTETKRDLDDPDRDLPGERGEPRAALEVRVPRRRDAGTAWTTRRNLARRRGCRTTKQGDLT
jgi:GNAT superfamily N-acetyltransferase